MKPNPISWLFPSKPKRLARLLAVTPPRREERSLRGVESLLNVITIPDPFSLEIAGDAQGVTLLARCREGSYVEQQLNANYPQAQVREVSPEDDPLRLRDGERAWSTSLRLQGPEYLPLRTFRDDVLLEQGSDPLIPVIGSLSGLKPGERLVSRIKLTSLGRQWSTQHQEKADPRVATEPVNNAHTDQMRQETRKGAHILVLAPLLLPAFQGYLWVQRGETWKAVLLGVGTAAVLAVAGWAWWRIQKFRQGGRHRDPLQIREKVSRLAYEAQVEITAILADGGPDGSGEERARELLRNAAAAYGNYDNLAGASFKATRVKPAIPATEPWPPSRGMLQARNVLCSRELAALWHPLGGDDDLPMVGRAGARALYPSPKSVAQGAPVGDTVGGSPQEVRFPDDLLRRHHFYVARTRMGKSTLMFHIILHKLREKAAGRDGDAIIVVDPHVDLVESLLGHVPEEIAGQVKLIDLADDSRAPGINLLDARVFTDRDRTADSVVRIAHGLWDQWGPRMQSILEHTVKALHEYNSHPDTREDQQLTILDGLRMLSDLKFRNQVLLRVADSFIIDWWSTILPQWSRETRSQAQAPVQTRLAYYSSSKKARAILGQPKSTIDLRQTIREGGVLLVSTAQGAVGRDVSALVGASLLNLVDAVVREQGSLPPEKRRGALVVVDEMQTMPGVDYESMLSELGKFGASLILATQSLAKLEDLSPTMRDTILANVGCLAVFQVSTNEARTLIGELDKARVDEEDLVSSSAFHCYIRAIVDGERRPTYSMRVRKPEAGDPQRAQLIRDLAWNYTTPADDLASLHAEAGQRAREFKEKLEQEGEDDEGPPQPGNQPAKPKPKPSPNGPAGEAKPGKKGRSRRKGETTQDQVPAGGGDE